MTRGSAAMRCAEHLPDRLEHRQARRVAVPPSSATGRGQSGRQGRSWREAGRGSATRRAASPPCRTSLGDPGVRSRSSSAAVRRLASRCGRGCGPGRRALRRRLGSSAAVDAFDRPRWCGRRGARARTRRARAGDAGSADDRADRPGHCRPHRGRRGWDRHSVECARAACDRGARERLPAGAGRDRLAVVFDEEQDGSSDRTASAIASRTSPCWVCRRPSSRRRSASGPALDREATPTAWRALVATGRPCSGCGGPGRSCARSSAGRPSATRHCRAAVEEHLGRDASRSISALSR